MRIKQVSWKELSNPQDRACAKLALIAVCDTVHGGARAMVLEKRLLAMGSSLPAREIVGDVYAASNWTVTSQWGAYACPECGQAHLGEERALECCASMECPEFDGN